MRNKKTNLACGLGVFILLLGGGASLGWLLQIRALILPFPVLGYMALAPALLFVLAGVWLILTQCCRLHSPRFDRGIGALIALWSGAVLLQYLFDIDLHVDLQSFHAWYTGPAGTPHRMAPNAALALLLAGLVIFSSPNTARSLRVQSLAEVATYLLIALGLTGLLGYVLQLEWLYWWFSASRMVVCTAAGVLAMGVALWLHVHRPQDLNEQGEITLFTIVLLIAVAVVSGLTGFAILKSGMEESLVANLKQTASLRSELFLMSLNEANILTKMAASRPSLLKAVQRLHEVPQDRAAQKYLFEIGASFLPLGLSSLQLYNRDGGLLSRSGRPIDSEQLNVPIQIDGHDAELVWADGFVLRERMPLVQEGQPLGHVITESRLPALDRVFFRAEEMGETGEFKVCAKHEDKLDCFPSRMVPRVHYFPFYKDGAPSYPVARAILGQSGTSKVLDFRGQRVFAAHTPIGSSGLGLVAKIDSNELYGPLQGRVSQLIAFPLILLVLSILLVRARISPLAGRLLRSEQYARAQSRSLSEALGSLSRTAETLKRSEERARIIIDSAYEAYIAMDARGRVTAWNPQATAVLGWTAEEAMGREVAELIIPERYREAHRIGMERFHATGEGPLLGKQIELTACHKEEHELPVELSIRAIGAGENVWFSCFMRDITERKRSEEEWRLREKLMLELADAVPSWVAYIDNKERYRYCNRPYLNGLGLEAKDIENKTLLEVLGSETYELIKPHVEAVLRGETASFERPMNTARGGLVVEARYVPDQTPSGRVRGFYVMMWDITEHYKKEKQLLKRVSVDALTGLFNRNALLEVLEATLARAGDNHPFALLFLDIDRFKQINDTLGHAAGDTVLIEFAARLKAAVRNSDLVARFGGDEFVILLPEVPEEDIAVRIAQDILGAIESPMQVGPGKVNTSTSIGIAYVTRFDLPSKEILNLADEALYEAKGAGRNRHVLKFLD